MLRFKLSPEYISVNAVSGTLIFLAQGYGSEYKVEVCDKNHLKD